MAVFSRFEEIPIFKYSLIMADPPWTYTRYSQKGSERAPSQHYKTMTFNDILSLNVIDLCQPNAFLWLWIPGCMAHRAMEVMEAWRFTPVTMGFWGKVTKSEPIRPHMGTGYTLRECGEPFFIGKVGAPKPASPRVIRSLILEPRREHSRKPEIAYIEAEKLCPANGFRLDMFSRQERPGWDSFGNEVGKFDAVGG